APPLFAGRGSSVVDAGVADELLEEVGDFGERLRHRWSQVDSADLTSASFSAAPCRKSLAACWNSEPRSWTPAPIWRARLAGATRRACCRAHRLATTAVAAPAPSPRASQKIRLTCSCPFGIDGRRATRRHRTR